MDKKLKRMPSVRNIELLIEAALKHLDVAKNELSELHNSVPINAFISGDSPSCPFSKKQFNRICRSGDLPAARKTGRTWLVRKADLERYVDENGIKPHLQAPKKPASDVIERELAELGFGKGAR